MNCAYFTICMCNCAYFIICVCYSAQFLKNELCLFHHLHALLLKVTLKWIVLIPPFTCTIMQRCLKMNCVYCTICMCYTLAEQVRCTMTRCTKVIALEYIYIYIVCKKAHYPTYSFLAKWQKAFWEMKCPHVSLKKISSES